jgi:hypothetical protein
MEPALALIKPTKPLHVIDLVRESGVDVSGWSLSKRGEKGASMNPRYCYEWAFLEPSKVLTLCLWHKEIIDTDGELTYRFNLRTQADELRTIPRRGHIAKRALRMDEGIKHVIANDIPIRAIIVDGVTAKIHEVEVKTSRVSRRLLDPEVWRIKYYDQKTGECVLCRGLGSDPFVDQFSVPGRAEEPTLKRETGPGHVWVRSAEVRLNALRRAGGRCEWCGLEGFRLPGGAVYLESHHIIPLSEGGLDHPNNVVALCPNHHREAHHGKLRDQMRPNLLRIVSGKPWVTGEQGDPDGSH